MSGIMPGLAATYTIPEVASMLGMSESAAYKAAARGDFPVTAIKVGGRWMIPRAPLDRLLGLTETTA